MLPWWGWLVFWALLVAGSVVWLGVLGRDVWRSAKALGAEVSRASELVAALEARVDEPSEVEPPPIAVTQPPHRVRDEYREQRDRRLVDRRARRAERRPPWARVD